MNYSRLISDLRKKLISIRHTLKHLIIGIDDERIFYYNKQYIESFNLYCVLSLTYLKTRKQIT